MPLQNRVTPFGEIVADPARGTLMGNRGILHDERRQLGRRRWQHRTWIACRLEFHDRHRAVMTPHRYTELFFHDEAVAIAAGHRPCHECRRSDFHAWQAAWAHAHGDRGAPRAPAMDRVLHRDRIDPATRSQRVWRSRLAELPDGTFIDFDGAACLVLADRLVAWAPGHYSATMARPLSGDVTVLTPRSAVATLAAGYRPQLHPSLDARKI